MEDIQAFGELFQLDWRRDLVDMHLLSHLSFNHQCNELMNWLIEEGKVDLGWRDRERRGVLEWSIYEDVEVGLVKYLVE